MFYVRSLKTPRHTLDNYQLGNRSMTDHFGSKLEGNIDIPEGEQNFKG